MGNQFCRGVLGILKDNPVVDGFLREKPVTDGNGREAASPPSVEDVEKALADRLGGKSAIGAVKPKAVEESPPKPAKALTFPLWFQSVSDRLPKGKTKGQFRSAKSRLKDICQRLEPDLRGRFFTVYAETLINQTAKTVSNFVNADQLVADAEAIAKELQAEKETSTDRRAPNSLFDDGEAAK